MVRAKKAADRTDSGSRKKSSSIWDFFSGLFGDSPPSAGPQTAARYSAGPSSDPLKRRANQNKKTIDFLDFDQSAAFLETIYLNVYCFYISVNYECLQRKKRKASRGTKRAIQTGQGAREKGRKWTISGNHLLLYYIHFKKLTLTIKAIENTI